MSGAEKPAAFVTADRLAAAMEGMTAALAAADRASQERDEANVRYGRRNRLYIGLDVLLTMVSTVAVGVAIHAVGSSDAATARAAAVRANLVVIHANQVAACGIGNRIRAQQRGVWDYLIRISPPPAHETAAHRRSRLAVLGKFERYIAHAYAPLDCQRLYRLAPKPTVSPSALPGRPR